MCSLLRTTHCRAWFDTYNFYCARFYLSTRRWTSWKLLCRTWIPIELHAALLKNDRAIMINFIFWSLLQWVKASIESESSHYVNWCLIAGHIQCSKQIWHFFPICKENPSISCLFAIHFPKINNWNLRASPALAISKDLLDWHNNYICIESRHESR